MVGSSRYNSSRNVLHKLRNVALAMVACGGHKPVDRGQPMMGHHSASSGSAAAAPSKSPVTSTHAQAPAHSPEPAPAPSPNRCDDLAIADMSIDGLLDDWHGAHVVAQAGTPAHSAMSLRCAWDGETLALSIDIEDDRVVRVKGGTEDRVDIVLRAGGAPVSATVYPGNTIAPAKIIKKEPKLEVADSLQPKGFSIEAAIPATAIPGFSASTLAIDAKVLFTDSDLASSDASVPIDIVRSLELGDRKDLLDDFLATVKLAKTDIKLDTMADLDPDRSGTERLVAGGTVIGVLTDQFAYVTLPVPAATDVQKVELLPLGPKGQQVVAARVRQSGNGGSRDLLMLWTVWSGQLHPLANIEVKKQLGPNILEATYRIAKGPKPTQAPELVVEPKPAIGFTADTWNEEPAGDADSIVLPWDTTKAGIAYSLQGAEISRRVLPPPKKK